MSRKIKVGKFEASLPAIHTLSVIDATRIVSSNSESQPFIVSQIIMKHLTYLQRKRFESLSLAEFMEVVSQWTGIEQKNTND